MENIKLEIDKILYKDGKIPARVKLERRIIHGLFQKLKEKGMAVVAVDDGDVKTDVKTDMEALELIFNLDEAHVYVKNSAGGTHWLFLVLGNELDVLSDWGVPNVSDGFDEVLSSFVPDDYA